MANYQRISHGDSGVECAEGRRHNKSKCKPRLERKRGGPRGISGEAGAVHKSADCDSLLYWQNQINVAFACGKPKIQQQEPQPIAQWDQALPQAGEMEMKWECSSRRRGDKSKNNEIADDATEYCNVRAN